MILAAGLGSAALMAVASSSTWLRARVEGLGPVQDQDIAGSEAAPLALALALVALASWGVILVSRTRARRLCAVAASLATIGVLVVVAALWSGAEDVVVRVVSDQGENVLGFDRRPWYWVTALAAAAQLLTLVAAYRSAPGWPTMSSRYDAPGARAEASSDDAGRAASTTPDLDLWKALDQGEDPTAGPNP